MQKKVKLLRIVAVLCSLMLLLSTIMTGTYAWQSRQEILNIAYGEEAPRYPVELTKLEKQVDGTLTEVPIKDTVFYIYSEVDGQVEQFGGRFVTDENGKINVELPAGNYYFEEITPSFGYTYDSDSDGKLITQYKFTVEEDQKGTVTVTAYNQRLTGSLLISKRVENSDASPLDVTQKNTAFEFTVTFSDGGSYGYKIDNGEEIMLKSGETLTLTNGQTAVFSSIPARVIYDVVETPVAGYVTTSTGNRGNINDNVQAQANFVNTYDRGEVGSLTVTKTVKGEGADLEKTFAFIATIDGVSKSFTLKHGEKEVFDNIPAGTEYSIKEVDAQDKAYIATNKEYTGKVAGSTNVVLPFVNVYEPNPEGKVGTLTIKKVVIGQDADPNKEFTFTVTFEGEGAPTDIPPVVLKANETKVFENLPVGTTYTVVETDSAGYNAVVGSASGTIAGEGGVLATFVNEVPEIIGDVVKLTVRKVLAGEYSLADAERSFEMSLTVDGKLTTFELKSNETKTFDVPRGASYQVREKDYIADGFSQTIVNGTGTANAKEVQVTVTNTYIGIPTVTIRGEKTWDFGGNIGVEFPENIIVRLKSGEEVIEEKVVTPDEQKKWTYTFSPPKYDREGKVATYYVEEVEIEDFKASYDGYNIKNIYIKPLEIKLPAITKIIQGQDAPSSSFEFLLSGQKGVPMPDGSEGIQKKVVINGAGQVELGSIYFHRPGTFVYTLSEVATKETGWTYDDSKYTITIVVTEEGEELKGQLTITKDGKAAENIQFTNTFEAPDKDINIIAGAKTWNHGTNPKDFQPTSIVVKVYGDGKQVAERSVTEEDGWRYSFELPRYAKDGHEIVYVIDEEPIRGYHKMVDGYNLVNTYIGVPNVPGASAPTTGDSNDMDMWICMMIFSFCGLLVSKYAERSLCKKYK